MGRVHCAACLDTHITGHHLTHGLRVLQARESSVQGGAASRQGPAASIVLPKGPDSESAPLLKQSWMRTHQAAHEARVAVPEHCAGCEAGAPGTPPPTLVLCRLVQQSEATRAVTAHRGRTCRRRCCCHTPTHTPAAPAQTHAPQPAARRQLGPWQLRQAPAPRQAPGLRFLHCAGLPLERVRRQGRLQQGLGREQVRGLPA